MRRVLPAVIAAALLGPAACGDGESQPLVGPPPRSDPADLYGAWTATQPGGYRLRYVFRADGTYRHFSGVRQRKRGGRATFAINVRGTMSIRGRTLLLRPRSGTQTRRDTSDPGGDYTRAVQKTPQRYRWTIRGTGKAATLTLSIGGALAVTYRRR